jgi:hypothetical protein
MGAWVELPPTATYAVPFLVACFVAGWALNVVAPLPAGMWRLLASAPVQLLCLITPLAVFPHGRTDSQEMPSVQFMLGYLLLGLNSAKVSCVTACMVDGDIMTSRHDVMVSAIGHITE